MKKLSDLLAGIKIKSIEGDTDKLVAGITDNSRERLKMTFYFLLFTEINLMVTIS